MLFRSGEEYFLMKNSWYTGWGFEENYMKISTKVLCGIGYKKQGYVPSNMIVYAGSCSLDKNCQTCNQQTKVCSSCKDGFEFDLRGMCVPIPTAAPESDRAPMTILLSLLFFILLFF